MSDEHDVRTMLAVYSESAYAKDVDRFMSNYADDVRIFDLWGTWQIRGASSWRQGIAGWFGSLGDDRVVVEFSEVEVSTSGDLASLTGFVAYSGESASGEIVRQMLNRLSWVLMRTDGAWLVIHEHTSAPVEDATGSVILSRD